MSCKKEDTGATPTLTFKSVNTTNVHPGETIVFTLAFGYKGTLSGSLLVQELVPKCFGSGMDTINAPYDIPSFPSPVDNKGDITVTYGYNVGNSPILPPQCPPRNDTVIYRFVLKADSAHVSDTVSSPPIVIYYQ